MIEKDHPGGRVSDGVFKYEPGQLPVTLEEEGVVADDRHVELHRGLKARHITMIGGFPLRCFHKCRMEIADSH